MDKFWLIYVGGEPAARYIGSREGADAVAEKMGGRAYFFEFGPNFESGPKVPEHLYAALERYVVDGIHVGGFLRNVLRNNLYEAVRHADEVSMAHLHIICIFVLNRVPAQCVGTNEKYEKWISIPTYREQ